MKKAVLLFCLLVILISITSCAEQTTNIDLDFSAADVESVDLYYYVSVPISEEFKAITSDNPNSDRPTPYFPTDTRKKVITKSADIETIINTLTAIDVMQGNYEPTEEFTVISFRFNLVAGGTIEIIHNNYGVKKGQIMSSYNFDYITKSDVCGLWDDFTTYNVSDAEVDELPYYEK